MAKGKKKGRTKRGNNRRETSQAATVYRGPIVTSQDKAQQDLHTVLLRYSADLSSDVAGRIAVVIGNSPTLYSGWASWATLYDEYRVLGMELKFYPQNRYSKTTTITRPIFLVTDQDDVSALTSYIDAEAYASCREHTLDDPFTHTAKMAGVENAVYTTTGTTVNTFCIKMWSDGLSTSTTYGLLISTIRVQFRGLN
jgi:hypothetical protein